MSDKDWQAYDDSGDIKEHQGYVPAWFSALFYGTIIIGIIYGVYYHFIADWSQAKEYTQEVAAYMKDHPQKPKAVAALKEDGSNPYRGNAEAIAAGQKTYLGICSACHRADGTGLVGPNLVDNKWLHGNTDKAVYNVVMNGISAEQVKQKPPKGPMLPHKDSLGSQKILEVVAYLASKNKSLKAK